MEPHMTNMAAQKRPLPSHARQGEHATIVVGKGSHHDYPLRALIEVQSLSRGSSACLLPSMVRERTLASAMGMGEPLLSPLVRNLSASTTIIVPGAKCEWIDGRSFKRGGVDKERAGCRHPPPLRCSPHQDHAKGRHFNPESKYSTFAITCFGEVLFNLFHKRVTPPRHRKVWLREILCDS